MNTKANAAAATTNAPTGKDDNKAEAKASNAKVQFMPVTEAEDNEYQELHKNHLDLTDEQEARYLALAKKIRAAKQARAGKIKEVQNELTKLAFSITDIFTKDDIRTAFKMTDLYDQTEIDAAATKKAGGKAGKATKQQSDAGDKSRTERVFASSANPIFIKIPRLDTDHQRTSDVIIHQGRTNEFYSGKKIFGPLSKPLARVKGKDEKETEANLAKYVVDEEYAKTEAGKTELKKIAAVVFANKE